MGILTILVLLPLIGAALIGVAGRSSAKTARLIALGASVLTFGCSVGVLAEFHGESFQFQLVENHVWISNLGVHYALGVDGISVWLLALTSVMAFVGLAMSRHVDTNVPTFLALMLALESFMLGAFASLDLILFFTFFELTLFPTYFLISLWGGPKRTYAASKFFIYTFGGSILMLVGIVAIGSMVPGGISFDLTTVQKAVADGTLWHGNTIAETLVFWAFAIAFLVKAPAFPFHTWMPDMYSESPTAIPVMSGVMAKLGTFGLLRFCLPLFPDVITSQVPILMGLAVLGIVYGGIVASVQHDMRRLMAYSSLSHVGFILLGIFSLTSAGLSGAAFQQLAHGVVAGGLIFLIACLWDRRHSKRVTDFSGLKTQMPLFATMFLILTLAGLGLPGTNGFIGEFLSLVGAFEASIHYQFGLNPTFVAVAALGAILAAVYMLVLYQKLFYGKVEHPENKTLTDIRGWEVGLAVLLVVIVFWGGIFPSSMLKSMQTSLQATRMMALNPVGMRPSWADPKQEIDMAEGDLKGSLASTDSGTTVVAPATLHWDFPKDLPVRASSQSIPSSASSAASEQGGTRP